jgi:transposase
MLTDRSASTCTPLNSYNSVRAALNCLYLGRLSGRLISRIGLLIIEASATRKLEALTSLLLQLIEESSKVLREVEQDFAADSSGLATRCYYRWLHQKYSNPHMIDKQAWVKLHLTVGVKTHIVTAVKVTKPDEGDSPIFEELIATTARNFPIREVSADKAYSSVKNLRLVVNKGAMPYIPFRSTTNPESGYDKTGLWKRMYHYYLYNQDSFKEHYHKRSNVETAFSMIKAKFGPYVRSKSERAQINEALCKVLCHNLCVVIQSIYELGIDPVFWA